MRRIVSAVRGKLIGVPHFSRYFELGSGLIDYSQKMTMEAMQIADMNV
jgi:hypothetical protein